LSGVHEIFQSTAREKKKTMSPQLILIAQVMLVPGTAMTYTDGINVWAGNPYCVEGGGLLQPDSPAIDFGVVIEGFHCPQPGSALDQPLQADGSYCQEWYGKFPDAGACEFVGGSPPPPPNMPPVVNAGADITITMPAPAQLSGTVTDDGLPTGALVWDWRKVSGPGNAIVTIQDTNALRTTATFSRQGTYVLRLEASDGELISSDDVTIRVRRR
jgi:hypothetical protein